MKRLMLVVLVVALLIVLGACTREGDENANEGVPASDADVAVEVELSDDSIQMPDRISAGEALFEVANGGTTGHGFAIEGIEDQIDEIGVDQFDSLRVTLEPGTYVVFSPVGSDRDDGLERELTVTEASASDAPDAADEAVGPSEQQEDMDDAP
jgi:hypothetical protein